MLCPNRLTAEEKFRKVLLNILPPIIARKDIDYYFGGIISYKTIANADSSGRGPSGVFQVGNIIVYTTEDLVDWIIENKGVTQPIKNITKLLGQ